AMADAHPSPARFDVYKTITDKILIAMETGVSALTMPWHGSSKPISRPMNAATKAPYRAINVLVLWAESMARGYSSGTCASYRQWDNLGAQVRKGQHGTTIVFFKEMERDDHGAPDGGYDKPRLIARATRVFNADQTVGWQTDKTTEVSPVETFAQVEAF